MTLVRDWGTLDIAKLTKYKQTFLSPKKERLQLKQAFKRLKKDVALMCSSTNAKIPNSNLLNSAIMNRRLHYCLIINMPFRGKAEPPPYGPLYFKSLKEFDDWSPGNPDNYDGIIKFNPRRPDAKSVTKGKLLVWINIYSILDSSEILL